MAHRITTQRRTLAGTDSKKSASMEASSLRKQPQPLTRPKNPDPTPMLNHKQLSKSFDSCQIQKPISQKAFYSLVGFSSDRDKDKVDCLKKKGFEEEEEKKRKKKLGAQRSFVSSLSVGVNGRRRSVGGAHQEVELADVFAGNGVKVVSADMPPFMQIHAVELARKVHDSAEKFSSKTLASTLKKEFDGIYGPAWHCIVGTSFGSFVTHSVGGFLYFSMDQKFYILLFKTTVQRAD